MSVHSVVYDFTGPPTKAPQTDRDVEMVRRGIEAAAAIVAYRWVREEIRALDPAAIARGDQ